MRHSESFSFILFSTELLQSPTFRVRRLRKTDLHRQSGQEPNALEVLGKPDLRTYFNNHDWPMLAFGWPDPQRFNLTVITDNIYQMPTVSHNTVLGTP